MTRRFVLHLLPLAALCLLSAGCGPPKGTVSGKVTHKNKPVVWGTVTIIASDNVQYAAQITPEGTYSIPNVPGGPVKISLTSPNPDGNVRGGPAATAGGAGDGGGGNTAPAIKPGAWFAIPEKYSDPQKSGLTGTVRGDTTIDVDLP